MKRKNAVSPPDLEHTAEVHPPRERSVVELAQSSADRAERLLAIMMALAEPMSEREVAELITRELQGELGAVAGAVIAIAPDGPGLQLLSAFGFAPEIRERFSRIPQDAHMPINTALRSRRIEVFDDVAELVREYPLLAATNVRNHGTLVAVPL